MRNKKKISPPASQSVNQKQLILLLAIVWLGVLFFHAQKALGFYPLVIPDEYTYSLNSRLQPFSAAAIPNYLYYGVFRLTNLFGERYLDAARVLNAIIFMFSAPFLFLVARTVCDRNLSLFVTVLTLIGPISSYTAYFMPESMYFTAFWFFAWLETKRGELRPAVHGLAAGAAIALLALVKMHGIFLLPGFALYVMISEWRRNAKGCLARIVKTGVFTAFSFLVVRFGVGFAFAGSGSLHLFGSEYGGIVTESEALHGMGTLLYYAGYHLVGSVAVIALIFGVPLAAGAPARRTIVLGLCLLAPLVVVTSVFSAIAQMAYPGEMVTLYTRLQTRYCNFLFPFLLIAAGAQLSRTGDSSQTPSWKPITIAVLGLSLYAFVFRLRGYNAFSAIPEAPDIGGIFYFAEIYYGISLIAVVGCALLLFRKRDGCRLYVYVFFPLYALVSTASIQYQMIHGFGLFPELHDKAGIFARDYLGGECSDLTVVDSFYNTPKKTLMHIDNPQTDILAQFTPVVDMSQVKPEKKWLLVLGGLEVPEKAKKFSITYIDPAQDEELTAYMERKNDFRTMLRYELIRIADFDYSVDPSAKRHLWPIEDVRFEGGKLVIFYRIPLPTRFSLVIASTPETDGAEKRLYAVRPGEAGAPQPIESGQERVFTTDGKTTSISIGLPDGTTSFTIAHLRIKKAQ